MAEDYNPGDEFIVTGGLDVGVNPNAALSADVSLSTYGTDTVGEVDQFEAGNKITGRLQYLYQGAGDALRVVGALRKPRREHHPRSSFGGTPGPAQPRRFSRQLRPAVQHIYTRHLGTVGRLFGETETFDAQTLFRVGIAPAFSASANVVLMPRVAATFGDLTGFQAGLTVQAQR